MGNPEVNLGILAAAGATWRLKELVGEAVAKQVLPAGKILTGEECLAVGLVTDIVDPCALMDSVHAMADAIAAQDPLAVRLTKAVFNTPREVHPVIDTLAQSILFESPAKFDRMQAFFDRKKK